MRSLIIAATLALAFASSAGAVTGQRLLAAVGHGRTIELRRAGGQGGLELRHNCRRGHVCRHPGHSFEYGARRPKGR